MMTVRSLCRCWLVPICFVLLLGGLALSAPAARAASTLLVTSCLDDGGAATLRGQIAAAAVGDTIVFDKDCTITLGAASGTLTLTKSVTINGTGHVVIVDGGCSANCGATNPVGGVTVFAVNEGVTANLTNLKIQDGTSRGAPGGGGGIFNDRGTLTVTNSTLSGNSALAGDGGGIYSRIGTLSVINSAINGNAAAFGDVGGGIGGGGYGGGIASAGGTLMVTNSTISGNAASSGGGISSGGTLAVTDSTIADNAANDSARLQDSRSSGGGIYNAGTATVTNSTLSGNSAGYANEGGAIVNGGAALIDGKHATLTVTNSTITGNTAFQAGGAGILNDFYGTLTVTNSTLTGNTSFRGAGINSTAFGATVTMTNTIVAGNLPNNKTGFSGSVISGGYNLIDIANPASGWNGTDLTGINAVLGPLGGYGGPTQTIPLLPGSPAIAAGITGAGIPGADQRGIARTGHIDIGAFQSQGFTISKTGGDNQSQPVNAPFAPLTFTVAAVAAGAPWHEPVGGALLVVTSPPLAPPQFSAESPPPSPSTGR